MKIQIVPVSEPVPYAGIAFRVSEHNPDHYVSEYEGVPLYDGAILDEHQYQVVECMLNDEGEWDGGRSNPDNWDDVEVEYEPMTTRYEHNDGGRSIAGRITTTGDCVLRAVAILEGISDYDEAQKRLHSAGWRLSGKNYVNPDTGKRYKKFTKTHERKMMERLGYKWNSWDRAKYGRWGRPDDVPNGVLVSVRKHLVAKVDGAYCDIWDSRYARSEMYAGKALSVYGWYSLATEGK